MTCKQESNASDYKNIIPRVGESFCPQGTGTPVSASALPTENNIILLDSPVMLASDVLKRQMLLPKLVCLE